jgi:excisionase family DNA binding protein
MFLTIRQTAEVMGLTRQQAHYLVAMGEVEAVKTGKAWRLVSDSVKAYCKKKAA